jgi:hypothetical protein
VLAEIDHEHLEHSGAALALTVAGFLQGTQGMSSVGTVSGSLSQLLALNRNQASGLGAAFTGAGALGGAGRTANSAAPESILPPSGAKIALSFEALLALQGQDTESTEIASVAAPSAEDLFLKEARKSPIERMREQLLEEMGLSEDALAALPPDERAAIEDQIRELIEEKLRQTTGVADAGADASTAVEGLSLA